VNEHALDDYHGPSGEDEAIYEIYYSNPPLTCGTVVEIGAGDGYYRSKSYFFATALHWKSVLIEADPKAFAKLSTNRPDASTTTKVNGAFCEGTSVTYYEEHNRFRGQRGETEVMSVEYWSEADSDGDTDTTNTTTTTSIVPCLSLRPIFQANGITSHIDVLFLAVSGEALAVLRQMDWTVRVDVWVIELDDDKQQHNNNELAREMLRNNQYVKAEWEIQRWCNPYMMGHCMPNEVWLKKGYNAIAKENARRRLSSSSYSSKENNNNNSERRRRLRSVVNNKEVGARYSMLRRGRGGN